MLWEAEGRAFGRELGVAIRKGGGDTLTLSRRVGLVTDPAGRAEGLVFGLSEACLTDEGSPRFESAGAARLFEA